jgi:hypothetical protein
MSPIPGMIYGESVFFKGDLELNEADHFDCIYCPHQYSIHEGMDLFEILSGVAHECLGFNRALESYLNRKEARSNGTAFGNAVPPMVAVEYAEVPGTSP